MSAGVHSDEREVEVGFSDGKKLANVAGQLVTLHGGGVVARAAAAMKVGVHALGRILRAPASARYQRSTLDTLARAAGFADIDALLKGPLPTLASPTTARVWGARAGRAGGR